MSIIYDAGNRTITLNTVSTTYQMKIHPLGFLLHTYYGPLAAGDLSYCIRERDRGFSGNPYDAGRNRGISADTLPMEYACRGNGDFRPSALSVRRVDGSVGCDIRYRDHCITEGKYSIPGLPSAHAGNGKCDTPADGVQSLAVFLEDKNAGLLVELKYGVFPEHDIITRACVITNTHDSEITLENAASLCLDISTGDWELFHFHGRHAGERNLSHTDIGQREVLIGSRRGTSSHQQNPFVILSWKGTGELHGDCIGAGLLYSGEFCCNVSGDQFGTVRTVMGIQNESFDYPLMPGESFHSPEVMLAFSGEGHTALSHIYHRAVKELLCRGPWVDKRRPVLINNWEATGIDFDGEGIISIASQAAELGVELMVLDDGWFGGRVDDNAGLGDWQVNERKLGCTLGELSSKIRAMGMRFGLWIEPEMVNEDSDLYRQHPDWAFVLPGKPPVRSRNQLVLDLSRPEIVDRIFSDISKVIDECGADYIKMDMNRSIAEVYSGTAGRQSRGRILYEYTKGVYRFMEMLLERYPDILLEGCSGGGGRFDLGMLCFCPQIWCSDNTDAIDRIAIQYGTSFAYPVWAMGAHVSAVPNHDTGRTVPFNTRAVVAMAGTFGYELDLNLISEAEKEEVRKQISFFKEHWRLLQHGRYYRLTDASENRHEAAWMMVSEDGAEAIVSIVKLEATGNAPERFVFPAGLSRDALYMDVSTGEVYSGAALMYQGLPIPCTKDDSTGLYGSAGQYEAFQILLKKTPGLDEK